jgi:protein-disulfide isomerase
MPSSDASELIAVGDRDHVLGADRPEVTLIEYGDFGCPFCFAARRPIESLLDRFDGLSLVWRHFPDPDLHPGADLAAELSELAAANGKFWEAHSLLLAGRESFSTEDLLSVARRLELDDAASALEHRIYRDRVAADVDGGESAGVHATPTFFANGELVRGPWRRLGQLIPEMLAEDPR